MHVAMMIGIGLLLLACFFLLRNLFGEAGAQPAFPRYAKSFLIVWALVSVANGVVGVYVADISILTEIVVLLPVYGVPALAAVLLVRWQQSKA